MIDLKLDTNAVMKLFGDEASRVKLQQAVINNVVQEIVLKNSKNKVQKTIEQEINLVGARLPDVKPMIEEEMQRFFTKKGWNEVQGTFELNRVMKEEANKIAYTTVMNTVNDHVKKAMEDLEDRIEHALKLSEESMERMITDALQSRFQKSLDKAIAARLKSIFPEV